jgi:response regulator RpfG family c-di-GMP phosphodiesterase
MPILFLTVQRDRETVRKISAAGADDYGSKPVQAEDLTTRFFNRPNFKHAFTPIASNTNLTKIPGESESGHDGQR